jgi:flagellin
MGLRIKTNVEAAVAQRRLAESRTMLGESLERMSSGQRINKSADDAAGLAISESIRAKSRSLGVAKRNANDGISYLQVAEGGLNEVTNIVVRMRELSAQAATDTIGNRERSFIDREFQQLRQEANRIMESTEFNGAKVLRVDSQRPIKIFVGATNRGNDASGNAPNIDPNNDSDVLQVDLSALGRLSDSLAEIVSTGSDDARMSLLPADMESGGAQDLGPNGTADMLNKLDTALNSIADYRGTLGAVQSRLSSTISTIDVSNENLLAAQSRIRDVDYATETSRYTQARILTQAGAAVLTQANSTPELALQLLRQ